MNNIEVGQIYESGNGERFVVTWFDGEFVSVIYSDGYAVTYDADDSNTDWIFNKIINRYSTWQKAVNSKEFNMDYEEDERRIIDDNR